MVSKIQINVKVDSIVDDKGNAVLNQNIRISNAQIPIAIYSPYIRSALTSIFRNRTIKRKVVQLGRNGSNFTFRFPQSLTNKGNFFVDVLFKSAHSHGSSERLNILESQDPAFSLSLRKVGTKYFIHASIHTNNGWQNIREERIPIRANTWYNVALSFDNGRWTILINGRVSDSRIVDTRTILSVGNRPIYAGTWIDGQRNQFIGKIGYVNMYSPIPENILQIVNPSWHHSSPINDLDVFKLNQLSRNVTNITGLQRTTAYLQKEEVLMKPDLMLRNNFKSRFIFCGDFDGDKRCEILISPDEDNSKGNDLWAMKYNLSTKSWDHMSPIPRHPIRADIDLSSSSHKIRFGIVGDFDGDGIDEAVFAPHVKGSLGNDLWARKFDPNLKRWDRMGDIQNSPIRASMDVTTLNYPVKIGFCGDVDGDGADELILIPLAQGNRGNDIWIMKYNKSNQRWGHFSRIPNHGMHADLDLVNYNRAARFGIAGDFDGDGREELAFAPEFSNSTRNNNGVWVRKFNQSTRRWIALGSISGNERFSFRCTTNNINYGIKQLISADVDGDGIDELIIIPQARGNRGNDVWIMKYNKSQKRWNHFSMIANHNMQADLDLGNFNIGIHYGVSGDFDGDGREELVFSSNQNGSAGNDLWFVKYDVHANNWIHRSLINNNRINKSIDLSVGRYKAGKLFSGKFTGTGNQVELGTEIIHGGESLPDTVLHPIVWNDIDLAFLPIPARTEVSNHIQSRFLNNDQGIENSPKIWISKFGSKPHEIITKRVAGFHPDTNGFQFRNNWPSISYPIVRVNINWNEVSIAGLTTIALHNHMRLNGLDPVQLSGLNYGDTANGVCGGMVFAAMDYYAYGVLPPSISTNPTSGRLFNYLIDRLFDSFGLPNGVLKYYFLQSNSNSAKLREMAICREWPKVKERIDNNQLCAIGQINVNNKNPSRLGENHQVLVYGYDIERYSGQVKLFMYDPNDRISNRENVCMEFNTRNFRRMLITENGLPSTNRSRRNFRSFFVKNYQLVDPRNIS